MNSKLKEILNKINLNTKYFDEFVDSKLISVKVNEKKNEIRINIHNKTNLTLELYNELEKSFKDFFNNGEIIINIEVDEIKNEYINDYYKKILNDLKTKKTMLEIFENSLVFNDSKYSIKVSNKLEEKEINKVLNTINDYLINTGFSNLDVILDEEERKTILEEIKKELVIIERPKEKKQKKEETQDTKKYSYQKREERKQNRLNNDEQGGFKKTVINW